jgi:hypothetical protein
MRGKRRCLHGGKSTGPKTLAGRARIRAATTKTGRWSAEGQAVERWRRRWFSNGYRSIRTLVRQSGGPGRIRGQDAQGYLEGILAREAQDGIDPALVEAQHREARAAVRARDVERLRNGYAVTDS